MRFPVRICLAAAQERASRDQRSAQQIRQQLRRQQQSHEQKGPGQDEQPSQLSASISHRQTSHRRILPPSYAPIPRPVPLKSPRKGYRSLRLYDIIYNQA